MKKSFYLNCKANRCIFQFRIWTTLLITLTIGYSQFSYGQGETTLHCDNQEYTFTSTEGITLCNQYGDFTADYTIGEGTAITHTSLIGTSLSGNIYIKGDLIVDNGFTFYNSIVKIAPTVSIFVAPRYSPLIKYQLTLDNSKLFACDGLWNGIILDDSANIQTKNGTEIEDAETGILVRNKMSNALHITNTVFNRNRIGISLEENATSSIGHVFVRFNNNIFSCTAPLNGTINEVTRIGVNIKNVPNAFREPAYNLNNEFYLLINGLIATGDMTDITIYDFNFRNIKRAGIDFSGRKLKAFDSTFDSVVEWGIYFHDALDLELGTNDFFIRETTLNDINRYMVQIENPLPGNLLQIKSGNFFQSEGILNNSMQWGVHLSTDNMGAIKAYIYGCTFNILNHGSDTRGIQIAGNVSSSSDFEIYNNDFTTVTNPSLIDARQVGIYTEGNIHNMKTYSNYFYGGNGLYLEGSADGLGNKVFSNLFEPTVPDFGKADLFTSNFKNLTVCNNNNRYASQIPYIFHGANNTMTFEANNASVHIDNPSNQLLLITGNNATIGTQKFAGNKWNFWSGLDDDGNLSFYYPILQHTSDDLNVIELSKFFVHTEQSTIDPNTNFPTFTSDFHPAYITPDEFPLEDAFFEFIPGQPNTGCGTQQLTAPVDIGDQRIAVGTYGDIISSPAQVWDGERHLFQKLQIYPDYEALFTGFTSFLQAHTQSVIGKFYLLEQKIQEASTMQLFLISQIETAKNDIEELDKVISSYVSINNYSEDTLNVLLIERYNLVETIIDALTQFAEDRVTILGEAEITLQTISPSESYQTHRKAVFSTFIQSQLYQNGLYDSLQVQALKDIACLCPEVGGMAVYIARGMLTECNLEDIQQEIIACGPETINGPDPLGRNGNRSLLVAYDFKGRTFNFYPNPSQGSFQISNLQGSPGTVQVFAPTGQLIESYWLAEGMSFWEVDLPSGVYFLRISFDNGEIYSEKLIINR